MVTQVVFRKNRPTVMKVIVTVALHDIQCFFLNLLTTFKIAGLAFSILVLVLYYMKDSLLYCMYNIVFIENKTYKTYG